MTLLAPDPIDFDDTWVLLESSLITILQDLGRGFPPDLWISLYTGVYKLCTKPMDPQHSKLYGRLKVCVISTAASLCTYKMPGCITESTTGGKGRVKRTTH